jgi:HD-GYP domain-containing protein (c-di-GMP phosphodiesterase class II)
VVNDLSVYDGEKAEHAQRLRKEGYRSSYTVPMYHRGRFFGFIFFNSKKPGFFTHSVTHHLLVHAELIALLLIFEFRAVETLQAAVSTARQISAQRDTGTGQHLDRMSRFARVVALELATEKGLSDEYIEYLFQFAPLHDIGKVAIPDSILLSAHSLEAEELMVMRSHVDKGVQIIDHMIHSFDLQSLHYTEILRNIVAYHHEAWDGSGYPMGLRGEEIPLEARIVALADVFDALTSRRSYKQAWSVEEAISFIAEGAGTKFDAVCVEALRRARPALHEIQTHFREDTIG